MIDVHLHLQEEPLFSGVEAIVSNCREAGIEHQIVNGTRPGDWPAVEALAERFPGQVQPSYGLHPWYVREASDGWETELDGFLRRAAIGVGEIGLDKWIRDHDLEKQKQIFVSQLALAVAHGLPVTIHCLRAFGHLLEILQRETLPERGFLLHSYGGPKEMIESFLVLGGYFSISGYFFHERKREHLRSLLALVPRDRLLVETDAPHMNLPEGEERYGEVAANHPANLAVIHERLAAMLEEDGRCLADQLTANARRLFGSALGRCGE